MTLSRLTLAAGAVAASAAMCLFAARTPVFAAQSPAAKSNPLVAQAAPPPPLALGQEPPHDHDGHTHAAPTNLKVLPQGTTGEQVHEIMEKWEGELGTGCKTCHAVDKSQPVGPNGRPKLNFADDSKEEKQTARKMYKMVEEINGSYISKIDSSGAPVTCGTCHRGHLGPEPYIPPPDKH